MSEQDGDGYAAAKHVPTFWRVVRPKAARSLSNCIGTKKLRSRPVAAIAEKRDFADDVAVFEEPLAKVDRLRSEVYRMAIH